MESLASVDRSAEEPFLCPARAVVRDVTLCALTPGMLFEEAARIFLSQRNAVSAAGSRGARYIRSTTERADKNHADSLALFFGGMSLGEIYWWQMKRYQETRIAGDQPFHRFRRPQDAKERRVGKLILPPLGKTPCPTKPEQANQELALLKRLKKLALCWTSEDNLYFSYLLEEEPDIPRALSPEEQKHWLDTCVHKRRWEIIHWYSLVALHSCAGTNELRGLRLGDISLRLTMISVPWACAKNKARHREIAIEDPHALWALERLIERANRLGAKEYHHFLFPFWDKHERSHVPARPMSGSGLKKLWQEVREASGLTWFRPYDMRHTAATRCAEDGVPVDVILARMGHVSDRMRRHYTHISLSAQRRWLKVVPRIGPKSVSAQEIARYGTV